MGYKCPKCGYERQPRDLSPEYECPKCGVIYLKYTGSNNEDFDRALAFYKIGRFKKSKKLFKKTGKKYQALNHKCQDYLKRIEREKAYIFFLKKAEKAFGKKDFSEANRLLKKINSDFKKTQTKVTGYVKAINEKIENHDKLLTQVKEAIAQERFNDAKLLCQKIKLEYPHEKKIDEYIEKIDKAKEDTSSAEATTSKQSAKAISPELQDVKKLIQCPDCGKEISKRATACPNCGAPIHELLRGEEYSECNKEMNKDNSCSHRKDKEINVSKILRGDKLKYTDNISAGVGIISIIAVIGMLFLVYQLHVYLDKPEHSEKPAHEQTRQERIEDSFSAWDGSHRGLTKYIKRNMLDPSSYEHIETAYWDNGDRLIVETKFRGKNAFGALVINRIKAKTDLYGNVIEIIGGNL